jgi:hypothetical protein
MAKCLVSISVLTENNAGDFGLTGAGMFQYMYSDSTFVPMHYTPANGIRTG